MSGPDRLLGPGREARVVRGRGSRVADFARGRGSRGAGRRPPATLPTLGQAGSGRARGGPGRLQPPGEARVPRSGETAFSRARGGSMRSVLSKRGCGGWVWQRGRAVQGTTHRQRPERFRSHCRPPLGSVPAGPNGPVQIGSQAVMIEPEGEGRYTQVAELLSIRKDIIDLINLRSLHACREFYSLYGCTD